MFGKDGGPKKPDAWVLSGARLREPSQPFEKPHGMPASLHRKPAPTQTDPRKNLPGSFGTISKNSQSAASIGKRQPVEIEIEESEEDELEIPLPPSHADRSVYSKATEELTTNESSTRRLFHDGGQQLTAREFRQRLMAAKKKFLAGETVVEIEISDDEQKKEREIAALKAKIREAEEERERLVQLHRESERQKAIEQEKVARLEREKKEKEKKTTSDQEYPEDKYLKQLSGIYKATHGKTGNRLSQLVDKDREPSSKESFASRFQVLEALGEGSSCVVRKVVCKKSNKIFAVKSCKSNDHTSISYIKKEHKILKMLAHDNIIKTFGIFESTSNVSRDLQDSSNPEIL